MNSKRFFLIAALVAVFSLALAACGGGGASTPDPLAVTINGEDIKFDLTAIEAKVGQTVNITYINKGVLDHTFLIDGLVTEQKVAAGQTITFSFTPKSAGTFEYYCNVAGHKEAGMIGTLTVTP
ncbi:MAG: cupredoxin domain-containing protein [Chloroflexota bacterium]